MGDRKEREKMGSVRFEVEPMGCASGGLCGAGDRRCGALTMPRRD
jgi:hypothetical protein